MRSLNYLVAIPIICILLEFIHLLNLVAIVVDPDYIRVFKVFYSAIDVDAVPSIDFLFNINIAVSITVQLLFYFWFSLVKNSESYEGDIGYLWVMLGGLFLANILLFAAISEWYTLPIKNAFTFDNFLLVVSSLVSQLTVVISSFYIGILMAIPEK